MIKYSVKTVLSGSSITISNNNFNIFLNIINSDYIVYIKGYVQKHVGQKDGQIYPLPKSWMKHESSFSANVLRTSLKTIKDNSKQTFC